MADDIATPANERDIANAIAHASPYDRMIIRRLAFERDMLASKAKARDIAGQQALLHAVETIIDSWDDWDAEAGQTAQVDQDDRSWRHVMRTSFYCTLWRAMGWPF